MVTDAHKLNLPYVQIKLSWSEHWRTKQHLEVDSFETALSPAMPIASLSWRAGRIADGDAGTLEYADYDPILETLIGYYVRIMRPPTQAEIEEEETAAKPQPVWYGVIGAIPTDLGGAVSTPDDEQPNCRGLEVLLERSAIDRSVTTAGDIDTVLPFNFWNAKADSLAGNRSSAKEDGPGGEESYVFSETDGEVWTAADVAEYLLAQFAPPALKIYLAGRTENLDQFKQSFGPYRNVREGLNRLISRQRGHAWRITVALNDLPAGDGSEDVMVYVYSCFDEEVTAGGIKLEAAATSAEIDGDHDMVEAVKILHSSDHQFDKVIVRGSPLVLIGTLSFTDSTLSAAWSSSYETAYENADDKARTAEKFRHVFTTYKIVAANLPDGPEIDEAGNIDEPVGPIQWTLGKRFLREIPLLADADDSDGPTEFRPPMVIGKYSDGGTKYVMLDRLADAIEGAPNIGSGVLDGEMGIRLSAYPQHLMGLNHFGGASSMRAPLLDYDELLVTAAWASNEHLQVEVEIQNDTTGEVARTLLIEVPQFQAWYRLADTVTDVQDSALVRPADAETLRNDRDKLAVIAAMAKAWYSRQRTACSVSWYSLVYEFAVGDLCSRVTTDAGDIEVNTTISRIHYDCRNGTTLLQTDFAELDFLAPVRQGRGRAGGGMRIPALGAGRVGDEPANLPVRPAAGGNAAGRVFRVLVTKDGGVVGSKTTECTYTYTVKDLDDTILKKNIAGDDATDMTPEVPRLHYCAYWYAGETRTAPAVATSRYALACRAANGDLKLLICYGEIAQNGACV